MRGGSILALDLATHVGWARYRDGGNSITFGEHVLPSSGPDVGAFMVAFEDWFKGQVAEMQPALVVFEAPILPTTTQIITVRKLYGLAAETERGCKRAGVRCEEARMQTVRKFFVGKGNAKKHETMAACRNVYGWKVSTDNEADACAVLAYSLHCHNPPALDAVAFRRTAA